MTQRLTWTLVDIVRAQHIHIHDPTLDCFCRCCWWWCWRWCCCCCCCRCAWADRHPGQQDATVDYPCPYVIRKEEEALSRGQNVSIPGNVVTVQHLRFGRTGNRFRMAYRNMVLGYCCKSKLVGPWKNIINVRISYYNCIRSIISRILTDPLNGFTRDIMLTVRTFFITAPHIIHPFGRTAKTRLWPLRDWNGEAPSKP